MHVLLWNLLKESLSPRTRRRSAQSRWSAAEEEEVAVEEKEEKGEKEGEGQRGTTTKEEDHVILLWYTSSSSVPGSAMFHLHGILCDSPRFRILKSGSLPYGSDRVVSCA